MHVGHKPGTVCALGICSTLPPNFLFGLLLHEFGHLGSGGGELDADYWILNTFGIRIEYRSSLDLEWIDGFSIARIVKATKLSTVDYRHNP